MSPERDPQHAMERLVSDLAKRTERVGDHLEEARDRLRDRQREARRLGEARDVVGHFEDADDTEGGDDPAGAGR